MHHETPEDSAVSGDAPDFFHVPGIQIKSNGHKCNHLNNQTPFDIKNDPRYSNAPARCVQQAVLLLFCCFVVVVVVVVCFVVLLFCFGVDRFLTSFFYFVVVCCCCLLLYFNREAMAERTKNEGRSLSSTMTALVEQQPLKEGEERIHSVLL